MLLRKELKKLGHASEVKLLPRELSNGEGRAAGTMVSEGVASVAVGFRDIADVGEGDGEELETEFVVFAVVDAVAVEGAVEEAEGALEVDVELLESPLSCRRSITALGNGGGSRRSKKICPLLSSRLNSGVS